VPAGADDRKFAGDGYGGARAGRGEDVRPGLQHLHQVVAPLLIGELQDPRPVGPQGPSLTMQRKLRTGKLFFRSEVAVLNVGPVKESTSPPMYPPQPEHELTTR
jgi:hypothetical protein